MPSTSQSQQKLFGLALSVKRGETQRSEVSDEVLNIVDTMNEKKIKDFAETPHTGLPDKVESVVRKSVREVFRTKVMGESTLKPKKLTQLKKGEKFVFNNTPYEFVELYTGIDNAAKVKKEDGKVSVISFGGGIVNKNATSGFSDYLKGGGRIWDNVDSSKESEVEQLDEKLITYSNRAPYGQILFLAGGAGSGKGFASSNFLDSGGFKVRDVDKMKQQIQKLDALGKISIDDIVKKFSSNFTPKDIAKLEKIQNQGYTLKTMNLKNPDHVGMLHMLVKAIGIKDKSLANMLAAQSNPEILPNIIFDITAKNISDITDVLPSLTKTGYKPQNIHLAWILTDYNIAVKQNAARDRVVPSDILLDTHIGAGNTVWGMVTSALPKGMDGRVDVILNNREHTIAHKDKNNKPIKIQAKGMKEPEIVVKGFLSLPVKKQGGPILPEKVWKDTLYSWLKTNGPEELTTNM